MNAKTIPQETDTQLTRSLVDNYLLIWIEAFLIDRKTRVSETDGYAREDYLVCGSRRRVLALGNERHAGAGQLLRSKACAV